MEVSVFLLNKQGSTVEVDVTQKIGKFQPTIFVYLTNISQIEIIACNYLDADLFVDCIVATKSIVRLEMKSCSQFDQFHFMNMLSKLPLLQYVNVENCTQISYSAVVCILSNLKQLKYINFDLEQPLNDIEYWKLLLANYKNVSFGVAVNLAINSK